MRFALTALQLFSRLGGRSVFPNLQKNVVFTYKTVKARTFSLAFMLEAITLRTKLITKTPRL